MDSIDIYREHCAMNSAGGFIFTIVQKSIRFAKMKKLAVYTEHDYKGTYEVVDYHSFRVKNLSNMVSLLIFGEHRDYGVQTLKKFRVRGRMSDETEMYFVCLRFIDFDSKFIIKNQNHDEVRNEEPKPVPGLRSDGNDVAPF